MIPESAFLHRLIKETERQRARWRCCRAAKVFADTLCRTTPNTLRIFRFRKFGTGTNYYLLISDYEFLPNNIITIQLFS
ncbi:hypothetical protein Hanom_Chr00s000001g01595131 [Helianthus anomalus]